MRKPQLSLLPRRIVTELDASKAAMNALERPLDKVLHRVGRLSLRRQHLADWDNNHASNPQMRSSGALIGLDPRG